MLPVTLPIPPWASITDLRVLIRNKQLYPKIDWRDLLEEILSKRNLNKTLLEDNRDEQK